jgi:hypothetical protein
MIFCSNHRLPENHKCSFDLKDSHEKILYQDALEFMNKNLTVSLIYEQLTKKELNKFEAIKLLDSIIEVSESSEESIAALYAFKVLNIRDEEVYHILENIIISDEDHEMKKIAEEVTKSLFPKEYKKLLERN